MTDYVADLSWKSGASAIEKLDRLRSNMAVNVLSLRLQVCEIQFLTVRIHWLDFLSRYPIGILQIKSSRLLFVS